MEFLVIPFILLWLVLLGAWIALAFLPSYLAGPNHPRRDIIVILSIVGFFMPVVWIVAVVIALMPATPPVVVRAFASAPPTSNGSNGNVNAGPSRPIFEVQTFDPATGAQSVTEVQAASAEQARQSVIACGYTAGEARLKRIV